MQKLAERTIIFSLGGIGYALLEILWRGYSHWSMVLTGGVCFLLMYAIHTALPIALPWRMLLGGAAVTLCEFAVGCTVNLWLGWDVWDYSSLPGNLLGQVCPLYTLVWVVLSALASPLCRILAREIRGENSPIALASDYGSVYNSSSTGHGGENRFENKDEPSF